MRATTATKRKRERGVNERKLANTYARTFNAAAERAGIDLPLALCSKLIELFADAMDTGAALERDYGSCGEAESVRRSTD